MDAEHPAVDDRAEGEVVEDLAAVAPDVGRAVFARALVVEAVDLRTTKGQGVSVSASREGKGRLGGERLASPHGPPAIKRPKSGARKVQVWIRAELRRV